MFNNWIARSVLTVCSLVFVVVAWLATPNFVQLWMGNASVAERDSFAAQFNVISALFSGLGFVGLLITIMMQLAASVEQSKTIERLLTAQQLAADSLAESIKAEQKLERERTTLRLYDEWHSDEMDNARIIVGAMIRKHQESGEPLPTLTALGWDRAVNDEARLVFKIVHFFERWALLEKAKLIDIGLRNDFLASYLKWWNDNLFVPLEQHEETIEHLREVRNVIREILMKI